MNSRSLRKIKNIAITKSKVKSNQLSNSLSKSRKRKVEAVTSLRSKESFGE